MVLNKQSFDEENSGSSSSEEEDVIYLNNAGKAILDPQVVAVGTKMVSQHPFVHSSPNIQDKIRSSFAQLIGADQRDIAIMPSTAFAITLAAKNIQRLYFQQQPPHGPRRNKILLLQDQMCSAVYPWQQLCDESSNEKQMSFHIVQQQGRGWTDAILSELQASL